MSRKRILLFLIFYGLFIRILQYLHNHSLSLDEAFLALNIIKRSFLQLMNQPLDYGQIAPVGFLFAVKFLYNIFGSGEPVLRAIPLFASMFSIFLFYKMCEQYCERNSIIYGVALFVFSEPLLYYSVTFKQYSTDVLFSILIFLISLQFFKKFSIIKVILFGLVGCVVIVFSHPSVFILSGTSLYFLIYFLIKKEYSNLRKIILYSIIWFSGFLIVYFLLYKNTRTSPELLSYWESGFVSIKTFLDVGWFFDKVFKVFEWPIGLKLKGLAALFFLLGLFFYFKKKGNMFFLLISPVPFMIIASLLHKYPLRGRLILFYVPVMLIFISEGISEMMENSNHMSKIISIVAVFLLLLHPVINSVYRIFNPIQVEETRPLIKYLKDKKKSDEGLYVFYAALPAFRYYSKRFSLDTLDYIKGSIARRNLDEYIRDIEKIKQYKKIWLLFSHSSTVRGFDEENFLIYHLDKTGERILYIKQNGASLYLYKIF